MTTRPIFSYHGGKWRLAPRIVPLLPPHVVYTEPFCGSAAVFWHKGRPTHETQQYREALNDKNGDMANVFAVARDVTKMTSLVDRLDGVPYSRSVYERERRFQEGDDDVTRAYRFLLRASMGFASIAGDKLTGWAYGANGSNIVFEWKRWRERLRDMIHVYAQRLGDVFLDAKDAVDFMAAWDCPGALHYVDPPYVNTSQGAYDGFGEADLTRLVDFLATAQGSVVMSGYRTDLVPADWPCITLEARQTAQNGKTRAGSSSRIEQVWILDRSRSASAETWKRIRAAYVGWRDLPGEGVQETLFDR